MALDILDLQIEIEQINRANGWFEGPRDFGTDIALIHSEASEALEWFRDGMKPSEVAYELPNGERTGFSHRFTSSSPNAAGQPNKPIGVPSELADIIVRTLDTATRYNIDIEKALAEKVAHNASRGHRHGGKVV